MNKKTLFITQAAAIAALYVVLTLIANAFGLANYAVQVRFSEMLTILPFFTPAAIPGLFLGCIISNTLTGCMILDTVFGSLATLVAAIATYCISNALNHSKAAEFLAPVPPIIANTIVVPLVIAYVYQSEGTIPFFMLTVFAGEFISCGILGIILLKALKPNKDKIFKQN